MQFNFIPNQEKSVLLFLAPAVTKKDNPGIVPTSTPSPPSFFCPMHTYALDHLKAICTVMLDYRSMGREEKYHHCYNVWTCLGSKWGQAALLNGSWFVEVPCP